MDYFGIGSAVLGAARIYFQSARRSGRTTALLESLKDGDRVITLDERSKSLWQHAIFERKLTVSVVVMPVNQVPKLFSLRAAPGRTVFDHTWVEQFYLAHLMVCDETISNLQERLSGREVKAKSQLQCEQSHRWNDF